MKCVVTSLSLTLGERARARFALVQMEEDLSSEQTGPDINLQWQLWDKQANNGTCTALAIGQQVYPNKHWHLHSV